MDTVLDIPDLSHFTVIPFGGTRGFIASQQKGAELSSRISLLNLGWKSHPCLLPIEFESEVSGREPSGDLKGSWEGED